MWILIISLSWYGGAHGQALTSIEFGNERACMAAADAYLKQIQYNGTALCAKKD